MIGVSMSITELSLDILAIILLMLASIFFSLAETLQPSQNPRRASLLLYQENGKRPKIGIEILNTGEPEVVAVLQFESLTT